jgi:hypothetical protein
MRIRIKLIIISNNFYFVCGIFQLGTAESWRAGAGGAGAVAAVVVGVVVVVVVVVVVGGGVGVGDGSGARTSFAVGRESRRGLG